MKKLLQPLVCSLLLATTAARAVVVEYTNEATFQGLGSIAHNSTFTDFGTFFGFPGNPFTRGDVTYNSTRNLTWGSSTGYTTTETLIGNDFWTPIDGTIATTPQYDMFGFYIGLSGSSTVTFNLTTNLNVYTFAGETVGNSQAGHLSFRGFTAGAGEYFTAFQIVANSGHGNLPGITHVQVGNSGGTQPVPEGSTTSVLVGLALVGLVGMRRYTK